MQSVISVHPHALQSITPYHRDMSYPGRESDLRGNTHHKKYPDQMVKDELVHRESAGGIHAFDDGIS